MTVLKINPKDELDELLNRLRKYYPRFKRANEVYLLTEMYTSTSLLKRKIDLINTESTLNDDQLESFKKRMDVIEVDLNETTDDLSNIVNEITIYKEIISTLKNSYETIDQELLNLIAVNDKQVETINDLNSKIHIAVTELEKIDSGFHSNIDNYATKAKQTITGLEEDLEEVDINAITSEISILKEVDVENNQTINDNYTVINDDINELKETINAVNIDKHKNDISALKAEDIVLENSLKSVTTEGDNKLVEIETEDTKVKEDLETLSVIVEGVDDAILIGSTTPEGGKVPLGDEDGYINKDWFATA